MSRPRPKLSEIVLTLPKFPWHWSNSFGMAKQVAEKPANMFSRRWDVSRQMLVTMPSAHVKTEAFLLIRCLGGDAKLGVFTDGRKRWCIHKLGSLAHGIRMILEVDVC